ncbi:MAG: phosphate/phosphite/phosphonate ABC transporter substrate-binding protein [Deltaproteobacteria bacterium]|nr:phosphate/phosphite/phosphonate ABC transporter substrate-binding protein [Deltaproteobacteria bacterium]NIS78227.1 phosphate/phosphite/phosphonate ABC transporter substrate-binding protein [Deltaproteobacteria bacterium]
MVEKRVKPGGAKLAAHAAIFLLLILFAGCEKKEARAPVSPPRPPEAKNMEGSLTIGLIPEHNIFTQLERYEPLARYLSEKIGREIELKVLSQYGNIIDNFVSKGLDGAFFGSFTYALAHRKLGVEALARPETFSGAISYHGIIFVRKDSGITTTADMRGKRFALVDKATTAGYLLPLHFFIANDVPDYRTYLKEVYFAGTHEDAIYDVLNRKADIGAAKSTVFERIATLDNRLIDELIILAKSPEVPENALAVRKDLDASVKDKLKNSLLTMQDEPEGRNVLKRFGAKRFIETRDSNYEPIYRYTREIGLNLNTYDYRNE